MIRGFRTEEGSLRGGPLLLALVTLLLGSACTTPPPRQESLPDALHYHGVAASPEGVVVAAHSGLYESPDGRSWSLVRAPLTHPVAVVFDGLDLVVGGQGGAWRRAGAEWVAVEEDEGLNLQALLALPTGLHGWVLGEGLRPLPRAGPPPDELPQPGPDDGIAAVDVGAGRIVAGGPNFGAFVSTDSGGTWTDLQAPEPVTAVAVNGETIFLGSSQGVWRSAPAGGWERLAHDPAGPVAGLYFHGGSLWLLGQAGRLDVSADGGESWEEVSASTLPTRR